MHRFLFLATFLFSVICASAQKKQMQVAAIAFYNFENLFDTVDNPLKNDEEFTPNGPYHYNSNIYHQKIHNLATVLAQLGTNITPDGPAIIGTAEIENETVLRDIAAQPEVSQRHYQPVIFNGPDTRGINTAMLYNPKYFRLLQAEALPVPISETGEKSGYTRDVLHVTGILMGDTVHVFVNHWPSRRGGEAASAPLRAIAAGVGKRKIQELQAANPGIKVILMGDLNDDPVSPSVAKVLGATGKRDQVGAMGLYNPFVNFYNNGIGTLGYNDAWNLFDQIMVSGSWLTPNAGHWQFYKAEVFNRDFLINKFGQYKGYPHRSFDGNNWINGYSDHFPTLVYVVKAVE